MNKILQFFSKPVNTIQVYYELMRDIIINKQSFENAAKKVKLKPSYAKKIYYQYSNLIKKNINPFFPTNNTGPKKPRTDENIINQIIELRKKGNSITDIQSILNSKNIKISLFCINELLRREGFDRLSRRTRINKQKSEIPAKCEAPKCQKIDLKSDDSFHTTKGGGLLCLLPLLEQIEINKCIEEADYPSTEQISNVEYIRSFLALKLIGNKRYGQDDFWTFDRGLGLFSYLNVLPKNSSLASYSIKTKRHMNIKFMRLVNQKIAKYFDKVTDINLDFVAIPHWGDLSVLEKNWKGSKNKSLKSVLAVLAQNPDNGLLLYGDAEIKHSNQNNAVIEFVDFWNEDHKKDKLKCLIFDSKFTTYENLNKLDKDGIKFITLRRRSKNILAMIDNTAECDWVKITLKNVQRKYRNLKIFESKIKLTNYIGEVRQILVTDNGREKPALIITNDFETSIEKIILKYARRWLVEKGIQEQLECFHLNKLSSSIVVKVDFDLTLSIIANNICRLFASYLSGYEKCQAMTLFNQFLDNFAKVNIDSKKKEIQVSLLKKRHLPILLDSEFIQSNLKIKNLNGFKINFSIQNSS